MNIKFKISVFLLLHLLKFSGIFFHHLLLKVAFLRLHLGSW